MLVKKRRELLFILIVLTGLFSGLILPEVLKMGSGTYSSFFSMYSFQKYETGQIWPWDLFTYILAGRLKILLFLWMSCFTAAGLLFHLVYAWWLAAAAGMLLALFSLREGTKGLLSFACCLLPQWILYAAMWKYEIVFLLSCRNQGMAIYERKSAHALAELGQMTVLCIAGCACEAFLGTWTLKIFLQYFS